MASHPPQHSEPSADLALAVYIEPLASGRRVLWIGDPASGAPARLSRVVRSLHVLAPGGAPSPVVEAGSTASSLQSGPLQLGAGGVDLVVVPDLGVVAPDEGPRVEELRAALGSSGILVAGTRQAGGYERLFALMAPRFECVRMLGQAPFGGWTVVDFQAVQGDYDVTVDCSLGGEGAQTPTGFIAVCSHSQADLDAYAVVQVPLDSRGPVAEQEASARRVAIDEELASCRRESAAADARAAALQAALEQRAEELDGAVSQRDAARRDLDRLVALGDGAAGVSGETGRDAAAPGASMEQEWTALEVALRDRGRELREAREEVERRGRIVRDQVEEMRRMQAVAARSIEGPPREDAKPVAMPESDQSGIRGRDEVLQRVLDAEASRVEAQFEVDEIMGRLADRNSRLEELSRAEATWSGRARGLAARLAEAEELREMAEGRLSLLRFDMQSAQGREKALGSELADVKEQLELELVRSAGDPAELTRRPAEGPVSGVRELEASEARLSQRVSELSGQLAAARDLAEHLQREADRARAEALQLAARVRSLEDQLEGDRLGFRETIAALTSELSERQPAAPDGSAGVASAQVEGLRGEVEGLRARLRDREAALEARSESTPGAPGGAEALDRARDDADALRAELEELRAVESHKTVRLADAEELLELEAGRAMDLASTVAARDALITRLQVDLAEEEQRFRDHERGMAASRGENERLREGLAQASQRIDQLEGLERRLSRAEASAEELQRRHDAVLAARDEAAAQRDAALATRDAASATLGDARRMLMALDDDLSADEGPALAAAAEITAVGMEAPEQVPAEVLRLRERIEVLEVEKRDLGTLVRSATAQLEERDEQIRDLARGSGDGGATDTEALRRELMAAQERTARLSEELLHEREARRREQVEAPTRASLEDREAEVRRLNELLGDKDADVVKLQGAASERERELKRLRETAAEARAALESLLGDATAHGDPGTADRIGELLRLLGRS